MPRYWVNTSTQNLVIEDTEFACKGTGPGLAMTRSWNAVRGTSGMFGNGWTFAYESILKNDCNGAFLQKGSGQGIFYTSDVYCRGGLVNPPVVLTPPEGVFDKLTDIGGGAWLWEEKESRLTYRYEFVADASSAGAGGRAAQGIIVVPGATRLMSVTDLSGNTVGIHHNADGTIHSIVDASGRTTTFEYDSGRRCTRMTAPDGRDAAYSYDARGNLVQTVDFAGNVTVYEYDDLNYVTSMTTGGKTTLFGYEPYTGDADSARKVASVTDAGGAATQYSGNYSSGVSATDPRGGVFSYTNVEGRTATTTDPLGRQTGRTYEGGLPAVMWDANWNAWRMSYDDRGNMLSRQLPSGHSETFTYDDDNNRLTWTNPLGHTWTYLYDDRRNTIGKTSPLGHETSMTYDAAGRLAASTDALGHTASYVYDSFGNLSGMTDPLGHSSLFSYDSMGLRMIAKTDALGRITRYAYDENDRPTRITHPDGSFQAFSYDCCAMTSLTDENGHSTSFVRNQILSPVQITDPLGGVTQFEYDRNNNVVKKTDARGKSVSIAYDAANRPTAIAFPTGAVLASGFDGNGNLVSLKDERGKETTFTYDTGNRLSGTRDPLGGATMKIWDAAGRILMTLNARGQSVGFSYDPDGRLTGKSHDGRSVAAFEVDALGNLIRSEDASGDLAFSYDAMKRVVNISYPGGLSLSTAYDAAGNAVTLTYPGGLIVQYTYDGRNRVAGVSWGGGTIDYAYDNVGNLLSEVRSNGAQTACTYDANNRFTRIRHANGAGSFADMVYVRDALGNVVEETRTLPACGTGTAQRTSSTYNDLNQVVQSGPDSYLYDADGNLSGVSGSRALSASYDPENRLTELTRADVTSQYSYNGLGQRVKVVTGSETVHYHYDSRGRLMFQTDGSGAATAYYIYSGQRLAVMRTSSGADYFYHFDKTGNTVAITDRAGAVVAAYAYSPFGEIAKQVGTLDHPFTYVGAFGVMDEGNGLYFMKNRYYDAVTGRFIQKDPMGISGGTNLYAYVRNNPVDKVDPEGLKSPFDVRDLIPGSGFLNSAEEFSKGNFGRALWEITKEVAGPWGNFAECVEKLVEAGVPDSEPVRKKRGEDTIYYIRSDFSDMSPEALGKEPERDPDEMIDLSDEE